MKVKKDPPFPKNLTPQIFVLVFSYICICLFSLLFLFVCCTDFYLRKKVEISSLREKNLERELLMSLGLLKETTGSIQCKGLSYGLRGSYAKPTISRPLIVPE